MAVELRSVAIESESPERFASVLEPDQWEAFAGAVRGAQKLLRARRVWNVNSTAHGGGVAEMLRSVSRYLKGAGIDAGWLVIHGNPAFFSVTKRLHNLLHGVAVGGSQIGEEERAHYEETLKANAAELVRMVRPPDVVVLHDPQTAGLVPALTGTGATVIWRCHIGVDVANAAVREGWRFLTPFVREADAWIFSRAAYQWEGLEEKKTVIIPPAIDPFSPKNQDVDSDTVTAILQAGGVLAGEPAVPAGFTRESGQRAEVHRRAQLLQPAPPPQARLVVQVSRWDRLKDPVGVMQGFAQHVAPRASAQLLLAGPAPWAVGDDPEGAGVLREVQEAWRSLPAGTRERVHVAGLPMDDEEENAVIVNALQRHAEIVTQKSLVEGFGLTVAEAMWKGRPVIASRVGGITDQVVDGESGVLVDPRDLRAFGEALVTLISDPGAAARLGGAARQRVARHFLTPRQLVDYYRLLTRLLG